MNLKIYNKMVDEKTQCIGVKGETASESERYKSQEEKFFNL